MLKFVNEGAVSYEQRAVSRELLEKCSQLIAHRSKLKAHCSKLIAYFPNSFDQNPFFFFGSSVLPCDSSKFCFAIAMFRNAC